MPRIPLKDCKPGQVLGRPVVNGNRMVLLPEGTELSSKLIERLADAGVEGVVVSDGRPADAEVVERLAALDARFLGHEDNPLMMAVKAVVVRVITGEAR